MNIQIASCFIFIHARHHGRARSHTDCGGVVMVVEGDAIGRESIDIRGDHIGVAIATERIGALVVRHQEDDIRPVRKGASRHYHKEEE